MDRKLTLTTFYWKMYFVNPETAIIIHHLKKNSQNPEDTFVVKFYGKINIKATIYSFMLKSKGRSIPILFSNANNFRLLKINEGRLYGKKMCQKLFMLNFISTLFVSVSTKINSTGIII